MNEDRNEVINEDIGRRYWKKIWNRRHPRTSIYHKLSMDFSYFRVASVPFYGEYLVLSAVYDFCDITNDWNFTIC